MQGQDAVVSLLLEKGTNVDSKDGDGNTPLHYASNKSVVSLLLENGADVNAKCNSGWTPLHHACKIGLDSVVSLLLRNGADANAKENILERRHFIMLPRMEKRLLFQYCWKRAPIQPLPTMMARLHYNVLKKTTTKIVLQSLRNLLDDN
jgi:hypothetical protein